MTENISGKEKLLATGGILGAIAASSCCILPLIFFSLGLGGAWIGSLTQLAPYKPYFVAVTLLFLGYGFYLVYWKEAKTCSLDEACARPVSEKVVKSILWIATMIIFSVLVFPYIAPLFLY